MEHLRWSEKKKDNDRKILLTCYIDHVVNMSPRSVSETKINLD